jgi:hypothetical protein
LRYFLAKPPRSPKGLEIVPLRAWRLGERLFSGRKWNGRSIPWITSVQQHFIPHAARLRLFAISNRHTLCRTRDKTLFVGQREKNRLDP